MKQNFTPSIFTISVKLLGIISIIIFFSLGAMIFFASRFFSESSETNIQENNVVIVQSIGRHITTELQNIRFKTRVLLESQKRSKQATAEIFFQENRDFLYVGAGASSAQKFIPDTNHYNNQLMRESNISKQDIIQLHSFSQKYINKAKKGAFVIYNVSQKNTLILSISYRVNNRIIHSYINPQTLFKALQTEGFIKAFIVDEEGLLISHPNKQLILSRVNYASFPIVATMLESSVNIGQTRYDYDNENYMGSYYRIDIGRLGIVAFVKTDVVFQPVKQIQRQNLYIMGIVAILAFLIVYFFARTLTVPLKHLVGATHQLERGNYKLKINSTFGDEIGSLTHSFKNMALGLGEREKMKDALGKFVNQEIADMVLQDKVKLGGDKKVAAIFFSDLRGFTALSEKMSPEEVVHFLNAYFTKMVKCINDTGGIVDKYIGDAIMAHWGAIGTRNINPAEKAIDAALMMRKALINFNEDYKGVFPFAKMGSGINTGPVIAGQIGSEERLEYTVIGDAVNLASRIEALNKPLGTDILISAESYKRVENLYKVEPMPAITVKGKTKPQKIYAIIGRLDDPDCLADLSEVRRLLGIEYKQNVMEVDLEGKEEKFEILSEKNGSSAKKKTKKSPKANPKKKKTSLKKQTKKNIVSHPKKKKESPKKQTKKSLKS